MTGCFLTTANTATTANIAKFGFDLNHCFLAVFAVLAVVNAFESD